MNKTKHPTKGEKIQDEKTQVLANEDFSKEGRKLKKQKKTNQVLKLHIARSISNKSSTYSIKQGKEEEHLKKCLA